MKKNNMSLVLEELRKAFDRKLGANDYLDQKLQSVLDFSSIIVAIVSAVTASALLDRVGIFYWIGLLIVLGLYICTFLIIKNGLATETHQNPISNSSDELKRLCIDVKEENALQTLIEANLFVMKREGEINNKKDEALRTSSTLMFAIVIFLFISITSGLAFPHLKLDDLIQFMLKVKL